MPGSLAFVIDELEVGGTQRQLQLMAQGLTARGWRVQVVCLQPVLTLAPEFEEAGFPVVSLRKRRQVDPWLLAALARQLRARRVDVVHTFSSTADFYGGLAARAVGCRFVGSIRNSGERLPTRHRWAKRVADALAHAVVANSRSGRDDAVARRLAPARKLHVVPNGVDAKRFIVDPRERAEARRALGIPAGAGVVVSVGRLVEQKGWDVIVESAREVVGTHPSTFFLAVGDGPLRGAIEEWSRARGLQERFLCLGELRDVKAALAAADIFLHASTFEGMSNAIMEAMASSHPVVATRVGGTAELVEDGTTGLLFEPGDVSAAVEQVRRLLDDPPLRRALGGRGRLAIEEHHSVETMVRRLERVYDTVLGKSGA